MKETVPGRLWSPLCMGYRVMARKIYYLDQADWTREEYYDLNMYLNKMFMNVEENFNEIAQMEIRRMSLITKTLILAQIRSKGLDTLLKWPNFRLIANLEPLEERLVLVENTSNFNPAFNDLNIGW